MYYAAMTWSHSINQKTKLRKLTQINRLASMMMAPARRSTPTRVLELINHLMPLDIYLHCLSLQAYNRHKEEFVLTWTGQNPKYPTLSGHRYFWQTLSNKLIMGATATDSIKENNIHKNYHIIIDECCELSRLSLTVLLLLAVMRAHAHDATLGNTSYMERSLF